MKIYKSVLKSITFIPCLLLLSNLALTQENKNEEQFNEKSNHKNKSDIIVVKAKSEIEKVKIPCHRTEINSRQIIKQNPLSTAFIFENVSGVYARQTQNGGGGPTIRGLFGNSILLLIDGIRLNTCITKAGNNQYISLVDLNIIENIDIVRGPSSTFFGSDALGGSVNFRTYDLLFTDNHLSGRLKAFYDSGNSGYLGHILQQYSTEDFAVAGALSYSRLDDVVAADNSPYKEQTPSGFSWTSGFLKTGYRIDNNNIFLLNFQLHRIYDYHRFDRTKGKAGTNEQGKFMTYFNPEFSRKLAYARFLSNNNLFYKQLSLTVLYQNFVEKTSSIKNISSPADDLEENHSKNKVDMYGLLGKASSSITNEIMLSYGFDIYLQKLESSEYVKNLTDNDITYSDRGKYQGGSNYNCFRTYLHADFEPSDRLFLKSGVQWTYFSIYSPLSNAINDFDDLNSTPSSFSGMVGGQYNLFKYLTLETNLSSGFKAPNLDDLTILGISKSNFEIPNPNLKPEYSVNYELSISTGKKHSWNVSMTGFYMWLFDGISKVPATYNGLDEYNGLSVLQKQNIGKSRVYGGEFIYSLEMFHKLTLYGTLFLAVGENTTDHEWMSRTIPLMGQTGIIFRQILFTKPVEAKFYVRYSDKQDRLSPEDKVDLRIPEGGTPAWYTLNLNINVLVCHRLFCNVQLNNFADTSYREHGAGLYSPGRHIILGLDYSF